MATANVRVDALSKRELVLQEVNRRMQSAWDGGDLGRAQTFNRMIEAFEFMTDDDWIAAYEDCHFNDV